MSLETILTRGTGFPLESAGLERSVRFRTRRRDGRERGFAGCERGNAERKRAIVERERADGERERSIVKRERSIVVRERTILKRERAFVERERGILKRERSIVKRERGLALLISAQEPRDTPHQSLQTPFAVREGTCVPGPAISLLARPKLRPSENRAIPVTAAT